MKMADCFALQELQNLVGPKKAAGFDLRELQNPEKYQKTIKKLSKIVIFFDFRG